jgi:hypothetical protein
MAPLNFDEPGRALIFPNQRKNPKHPQFDPNHNPKAPDYEGEFLGLDGVQYRIAGWLREGQNGKFLSCKITLPDPRYGRESHSQNDSGASQESPQAMEARIRRETEERVRAELQAQNDASDEIPF